MLKPELSKWLDKNLPFLSLTTTGIFTRVVSIFTVFSSEVVSIEGF
jgi:hypothetical protein